jgi:ATP-binding cassette subfamily B protein
MMQGHWRMIRPNELDQDAKISKDLVWRVFRFAKPYHARIAGYLILIVVASGVAAVPPLLYKAIIDKAIRGGRLDLLTLLAFGVLVVAVASAVLQIVTRLITSKIGEGLIYDLRVALFNHVQRMPIAFFTRTQTGALISRLNNDVVGAQRAVTETIGTILQTVIGVTITLVVMFSLQWQLTLISLALVPLFVIPTRRMGKALQKLIKKQMELNASMNTQMTERFQVGGALLVKLFGSYSTEQGEFGNRAGGVRDLGVKTALYGRMFFVAFGFVAAVGTALVYWIGGRQVIEHTLTLGTLVAFSAYLTQLYAPITMLTNARVDLLTAFVSFERVFEVLDFPSSIVEKPGAAGLVAPRGLVEFRKVWFRYPRGSEVSIASLEEGKFETSYNPEAWVLKEVSFSIEPGKMVALVGPSGAGKTTISMLVPRLYDVNEGAVQIDGHDVRDLTIASLSKAIATVTQDPHMFHDSIRANLMYAKPDATEAELIEVARAAQIHDLISSLPDRYDTMVGERGYRLSGGEKQRLAIARLLLKDPAVMILDEATAHLDSESELLIQRALAQAFAGRSSLVIAHRLSTIVSANEILVIDAGRIVERGTHFDLLDGGGLYEELYRTQFQRAEMETFTPTDGGIE